MDTIAIRPGMTVAGQDGPFGRVTHVVVDEATRQLDQLVVERVGQEWLIPADTLAWTGGQLTLRGTWRDLQPAATAFVPEEFDTLHDSTTALAAPSPSTRRAAMATEAPEGGGRLELRQEELLVRKRLTETGAVELRKEVVAEQQTVEVPVRREEVLVERHPVDRVPADGPIGEERAITVVLREEAVEVTKQPVVTDVVRVRRRAAQRTEQIEETVRREVADVHTHGQLRVED